MDELDKKNMDDVIPINSKDIDYILSDDFTAPITFTLNDLRTERLADEIYSIYLVKGKNILSKASLRLLSQIRAEKIVYGLTFNDYMEELIKRVEENNDVDE